MAINQSSQFQVENFHKQVVDLIKKYQFRDRNRITCCGISVSQCYTLETLHTHGALTMQELADKMYLSVSTMTRVVDQLVKKQFVVRQQAMDDGRVRLITLTESGEEKFQEAWSNIFESEKVILDRFPPDQREMLITFLKQLNRAVDTWQTNCCTF